MRYCYVLNLKEQSCQEEEYAIVNKYQMTE